MMRIVLCEAAHARQPVQHTAALVAVDGAVFSIADGQVTVGADIALVDVEVEWAVHRFDVILCSLNIDRSIHILVIEAEVPEVSHSCDFPMWGV